MNAALITARLLLVAVFATAGLFKLVDTAGAKKAIADFGLPASLAAPLGIALPLAELATAALLVPTASAWWGAMAALTLLLVFTAAIGINLAHGRKPDCRCFGQVQSRPVSWRTLARNAALAALAGFLVWRGPEDVGPSAVAWLSGLTLWQFLGVSGGAIGTAVIAAQSWFLLQLFRQHGRLLLRIDALEEALAGRGIPVLEREDASQAGLPVGAHAPAFELPDLVGARVKLEGLRSAGKPVLLVFTDPDCGPCNALAPDLALWREQYEDALTLIAVSRGTPEQNRKKLDDAALPVLLQDDREVAGAYVAYGTPAAVVVRPDGTIGSGLAMGADAIRRLVTRTARAPALLSSRQFALSLPTDRRPGDPAPAFELQEVDSGTVRLANFRV